MWESLYDVVIFQSVTHPPSGEGIAYIAKVPLLPSQCIFFIFGYRISFFGSFKSILLRVVQQLVVIFVFS